MYFKSRTDAGKQLAAQIAGKYRHQPCTVVALSDGAVMVGAQIALALSCPLALLMADMIKLPREDTSVGGMSQDGDFTYNSAFSSGEIDELVSEYHSVIEQEKLEKMHHLHEASGGGELLRKDLLHGRNVILVADGLPNGFALDIAADFLKLIEIKRLIVATPLASVSAVDRMHILADEIYCLSVVADYITTEHYYDQQDVPSHETTVSIIKRIMQHWQAEHI